MAVWYSVVWMDFICMCVCIGIYIHIYMYIFYIYSHSYYCKFRLYLIFFYCSNQW